MNNPEKKPLGDPLPLSDDDLRELTTSDEIKKAQGEAEKLWRESVDPEIADLLDALDAPE